jgi:hypothetical protein
VTSPVPRPARSCAQHVRCACVSLGVILLAVTPALSATIHVSSYNTWQWNGFSSSASAPASTVATFSAKSSAATSSPLLSLAHSELLDASGASFGTGGTGVISGLVFYDANKDDKPNLTEWAIACAQVALSMIGSSVPEIVTRTQSDGSYKFTNLPAGKYTLEMITPCGEYYKNTISNIDVTDGYVGRYDFAEPVFPVGLISKRSMLNAPMQLVHVVPEPGSLVLCAAAAMFLGGLMTRRHRDRSARKGAGTA